MDTKKIDDLCAWEMVEGCLHDLEVTLYGAAKDARHSIYKAIAEHLSQMLLIDGGPTFGLAVLEEACAELRKWEAQRGRKEVGPFLSKAHREKLMNAPGRHLRQLIELTGPKRWEVVDDWHG